MDWTLSTERTTWELVAAVAVLLFCGVGASAFGKSSKTVALLRFCFLLAAATLFFDPVLTRRTQEKPVVLLTLDDSASVRRGLDASTPDGETVATRCVSLARLAEETARRRGFSVALQTLSGKRFASWEALGETMKTNAPSSPLRELALNGKTTRRVCEEGAGSEKNGGEVVLLFSDGIQNSGGDADFATVRGEGASLQNDGANESGDAAGSTVGTSVDAIAVGVSTGALDWRWSAVDAPTTVYPGSDATLRAELSVENVFATEAEKGNGAKTANGEKLEAVENREVAGVGWRSRRGVVRLWTAPVEKNDVGGENNRGALSPTLLWENVVDVEIGADGRGVVRIERELPTETSGTFDYFLFVADIEDAKEIDAKLAEKVAKNGSADFNEFCLINNAARFRVDVNKKKLAVLLIDDAPRYEYRYLRELLRREEGVALKTLLFSADDATRVGDETAFSFRDFTRRRLAEFDAILIGDVPFERWGGKAQTLVDVATRDGSETSIWFLGGGKTLGGEADAANAVEEERENGEGGESGASLTSLLAPGLLAGEGWENGADGDWRLAPTPRGLEVFGGLASFWRTLETETEDALGLTRVFRGKTADVGTETLLVARNASDGREFPLLTVATLGKNKALAQGTDELWRLRTLGDKTVYRRFVLRTLEFLTDGGEGGRSGVEADAKGGDVAVFDFGADLREIKDVGKKRATSTRETSDVAARTDVLREIAKTTGGEALDLRDLDEETAREAARAFFERRFGEYPDVVVERSSRLAGRDAIFAFLFLFWGVAWALERRLERNDATRRTLGGPRG